MSSKKSLASPSPLRWAMPGLNVDEDPLLVSVDFHAETTIVREYGPQGVVRTWPASAQDIAQALARELSLSTGLLPKDTLWWNRRANGDQTAVWREPKVRTVKLNQGNGTVKEYRIPLPGLVFISGAGQNELYVFAAKERPRLGQDDIQLYHCPTLNVYEDGRICVGNHVFPGDAGQVPEAFFESYFSQNHLGHGKSRRHPDDIRKLWEELDGKRKFPLYDLVPHVRLKDALQLGGTARDEYGE